MLSSEEEVTWEQGTPETHCSFHIHWLEEPGFASRSVYSQGWLKFKASSMTIKPSSEPVKPVSLASNVMLYVAY